MVKKSFVQVHCIHEIHVIKFCYLSALLIIIDFLILTHTIYSAFDS